MWVIFIENNSIYNNNNNKGSWKQATVGLMLFRCDYAETTIIIIIIIMFQGTYSARDGKECRTGKVQTSRLPEAEIGSDLGEFWDS